MNIMYLYREISTIFQKQTSNTIEWIKWIAILIMVIDHIGLIILDNNMLFRSIGRISFPLFGYLLMHNYIYNTSNKIKYIKRLFIFALLSQPIYSVVIGGHLNIFILLSTTLFSIYLFEKVQLFYPNLKYIQSIIQIIIIIYFSFLSSLTGYAIQGYIFLWLLYFSFNYKSIKYTLFSLSIINLQNFLYIILTYASIPIIYFSAKIPYRIERINKLFFYFFYPLHLLVLYKIKLF